MGAFLTHAVAMESLQFAAGQPGAPVLSAHEVAGELWLQVHRFDDARAAFERAVEQVGRHPHYRGPGASLGALTLYRYRQDVLDALGAMASSRHPRTPPELVHEFVSDLYRFELRRLRDRLVRHEIPKHGYADRVVDLRRKYPLISLKPGQWLE